MVRSIILGLALPLGSVWFGCSAVNERPPTNPGAAGAGTCITEIHMTDSRNGWAWSSDLESTNLWPPSLLLHTTDGGRTWSDRSPRPYPYLPEGSCFFDAQNAWVSTLDRKSYRGGLLHTTDGGKSWSVLIRQGAASYGCFSEDSICHFFNANDGVANTADGSAGSSLVRFFETDNGGRNWEPVVIVPPGGPDANVPPGTVGLSDITPERMAYCPPANVIITHGDLGDERPKDTVRLSVSTNLGKSWRDLKLPLPSEKYRDGLVECDSPVFLDGKNGWLPVHIVKYGAAPTFAWNVLAFYTTHDGGETWTPQPGVIEGGTNFIGSNGQVDIVSARDLFVRAGADLLVSHDGAKSWRTIKPDIDFDRQASHRDLSEIDFVDARHGWVVVHDLFNHFPHDQFALYKTADGGATWTELPMCVSHRGAPLVR